MTNSSLKVPLLFGNESSQIFTEPEACVSAFKNNVTRFTTGSAEKFLYKYSEFKLNELVIVSELLTHVEIGAVVNSHTFLLAIDGYYEIEFNKTRYRANSNVGLIIPPIQDIPLLTSTVGFTRGLMINFDVCELNRVSIIMTGEPIKDIGIRTIPLQLMQANFFQLLLSWVSQIDSFRNNDYFLKQHGFTDQYYRLLVMMLNPELFIANKNEKRFKHDDSAVDVNFVKTVEEYAELHLEEPVNITNLQIYTGLSARGLQYASQKYFGCSPRQYLYNYKLDRALKLLKYDTQKSSILEISEYLGFSSQSRFSMFFLKRFGCKPSEIKKKADDQTCYSMR